VHGRIQNFRVQGNKKLLEPTSKMACDRECAVCYSEAGPFCKLSCSHEFCGGCIKSWYLKGTGGGCPMCRRPIYFRGFHTVRDQWDEDAQENKFSEVYSEAMDAVFEEACEIAEGFGPRTRARILREVIEDFKDLERTYNALRNYGADPDQMAEAFYYEDYYSDRHMNKCVWLDEPVKEMHTRYPKITAASRPGLCSRARARQDPWFTVNIVLCV
jgi:hypothetical protein